MARGFDWGRLTDEQTKAEVAEGLGFLGDEEGLAVILAWAGHRDGMLEELEVCCADEVAKRKEKGR